MTTLETEIRIEAAPEQVWAVLMDFKHYAGWNPFLISVEGKPVVGSLLTNQIRLNEKKQMQFKPEVLKVEENREFRWKGKAFVKGLFDGEHYFKLTPQDDGSTLLVHGESFSGLLLSIFMKMIAEDTKKGFEAMNKALKQRVESQIEEVGHAD